MTTICLILWLALLFTAVLGGRHTYASCPGVRGCPVVVWRDQSGHRRDAVQAP